MTYGGRWVTPPELRGQISHPLNRYAVDPAKYYFRTNPLFETGSEPDRWLNDVVCVGKGYLSLLPQFLDPERGSILAQSVALGTTQILVSVSVNSVIALSAGSMAAFLAARPLWAVVQRWLMATVLGGLAVRMALEPRR